MTSEWISVKERLPKTGSRVLVVRGKRRMQVAVKRKHGWEYGFVRYSPTVFTHWMPLPNPPKS